MAKVKEALGGHWDELVGIERTSPGSLCKDPLFSSLAPSLVLKLTPFLLSHLSKPLADLAGCHAGSIMLAQCCQLGEHLLPQSCPSSVSTFCPQGTPQFNQLPHHHNHHQHLYHHHQPLLHFHCQTFALVNLHSTSSFNVTALRAPPLASNPGLHQLSSFIKVQRTRSHLGWDIVHWRMGYSNG